MADFVEQAVLKVIDDSSGPIRKINSELIKMLRTSRQLRNIKIDIPKLASLTGQVKKLNAELRKIPKSVNTKYTLTGERQIKELLALIARIPQRVSTHINVTGIVQSEISQLSASLRLLNAQRTVIHVDSSQLLTARLRASRLRTELTEINALTTMASVNSTSILTAIARVNALEMRLNNLPQNTRVRVTIPPVDGGTGGNSGGPAGGPMPGGSGNPKNRLNPLLYAGATSINYGVAGLALYGVATVTVNAAQAVFAGQALTTAQNLTLDERDTIAVNSAAEQLLPRVENFSLTDMRAIGTDLARAIQVSTPDFDAFNPSYVAIFDSVVRALEEVRLLRPATRQQDQDSLNRLMDLAQISEDPIRAQSLAEGYADGLGAVGPLFDTLGFVAALRNSGQATTIDGQGLFRLMLAYNERGRYVGTEFDRMVTVLTQDSGVDDKQTKLLQNAGLIGDDGQVIDPNGFLGVNNAAYIESQVVPALERINVNIDDATEVTRGLAQIGFVTGEANSIALVIAGIGEAAHAYQQSQASNMTAQEASALDLAQSFDNLAKSADTLANKTLIPLAEELSPYIDAFANSLEALALGNPTDEDMKTLALGVGGTVGVAGGAFLGLQALMKAFFGFNSVTTTAHTAAMAAHTRALTVASVTGGGGLLPEAAGGGIFAMLARYLPILSGLAAFVVGTTVPSNVGVEENVDGTAIPSDPDQMNADAVREAINREQTAADTDTFNGWLRDLMSHPAPEEDPNAPLVFGGRTLVEAFGSLTDAISAYADRVEALTPEPLTDLTGRAIEVYEDTGSAPLKAANPAFSTNYGMDTLPRDTALPFPTGDAAVDRSAPIKPMLEAEAAVSGFFNSLNALIVGLRYGGTDEPQGQDRPPILWESSDMPQAAVGVPNEILALISAVEKYKAEGPAPLAAAFPFFSTNMGMDTLPSDIRVPTGDAVPQVVKVPNLVVEDAFIPTNPAEVIQTFNQYLAENPLTGPAGGPSMETLIRDLIAMLDERLRPADVESPDGFAKYPLYSTDMGTDTLPRDTALPLTDRTFDRAIPTQPVVLEPMNLADHDPVAVIAAFIKRMEFLDGVGRTTPVDGPISMVPTPERDANVEQFGSAVASFADAVLLWRDNTFGTVGADEGLDVQPPSFDQAAFERGAASIATAFASILLARDATFGSVGADEGLDIQPPSFDQAAFERGAESIASAFDSFLRVRDDTLGTVGADDGIDSAVPTKYKANEDLKLKLAEALGAIPIAFMDRRDDTLGFVEATYDSGEQGNAESASQGAFLTANTFSGWLGEAVDTAAQGAFLTFPDELALTLDTGATDLETTFQTSAVAMGTTIDESSMQFGPNAANGFLAMAPEIGRVMGLAAAQQLQNIVVGARVPQNNAPRLAPVDTGAGPF